MRLELVSFSDRGAALAESLCSELDDARHTPAHGAAGFLLANWTAAAFGSADALVFVGAVGIAVRAIAPHVVHKASDPAVVVLDEFAHYCIPLLSGHLGGANDLARTLSRQCGAVPVITTATDLNGVFAVDCWAKCQGLAVANPDRIKLVSAKLLTGNAVYYRSEWEITGEPPDKVLPAEGRNYDFLVSVKTKGRDVLRLVPPIAVIGVGCRRGIPRETIEEAYQKLLAKTGLCEAAVSLVCSIDLKANEAGLLDFCKQHGFTLKTFTAAELGKVEGSFSSSAFVQSITGVDNVCERSAVLGSGGKLYSKKDAGNGVTMAVALRPFVPTWRWRDE